MTTVAPREGSGREGEKGKEERRGRWGEEKWGRRGGTNLHKR
jgi:hypothetical protein